MKRIFLPALCSICLYGTAFSTTFDDCLGLGFFFNKNNAEIHRMLTDYEAKLTADPLDNYASLAVGILYDALAMHAENPEKGAAEMAVRFTGKFLEREKNNPLALIYLGMGQGFIARDSIFPITKLLSSGRCFDACDNAVRLAGGKTYEWNIRFMRANIYSNFPDFFNKKGISENDYRFIENEYMKNPDEPSIRESMGRVFFSLGEIERSKGDTDKAVEYWKKSIAIYEKYSVDTYEYRTARKRLEAYGD